MHLHMHAYTTRAHVCLYTYIQLAIHAYAQHDIRVGYLYMFIRVSDAHSTKILYFESHQTLFKSFLMMSQWHTQNLSLIQQHLWDPQQFLLFIQHGHANIVVGLLQETTCRQRRWMWF